MRRRFWGFEEKWEIGDSCRIGSEVEFITERVLLVER